MQKGSHSPHEDFPCRQPPSAVNHALWFDPKDHFLLILVRVRHHNSPRRHRDFPPSSSTSCIASVVAAAAYRHHVASLGVLYCDNEVSDTRHGNGMERNVARRRSGRVKWKLLPRFSKKRHQIDDDGYGGWSRVVLRACLPITLAAAGVENFLFLSNLHLFL